MDEWTPTPEQSDIIMAFALQNVIEYDGKPQVGSIVGRIMSIEELRKQYNVDNDDELILRALVPEADLDKMWAAGPVRKDYPLLSTPELEQARRLMSLANSPVVQVKSAGLELSLKRKA